MILSPSMNKYIFMSTALKFWIKLFYIYITFATYSHNNTHISVNSLFTLRWIVNNLTNKKELRCNCWVSELEPITDSYKYINNLNHMATTHTFIGYNSRDPNSCRWNHVCFRNIVGMTLKDAQTLSSMNYWYCNLHEIGVLWNSNCYTWSKTCSWLRFAKFSAVSTFA